MFFKRNRRPTTPGEILRQLYLDPHEISIPRFAEAVGVTRKHMSNVVNGHAAITAELATRIADALGTTPEYWLNLQNAVDLYDARQAVAASDRPVRRELIGAAG